MKKENFQAWAIILIALASMFAGCGNSSAEQVNTQSSANLVRAKVVCETVYHDRCDYGDLRVMNIDKLYKVGDVIQFMDADWKVVEIETPPIVPVQGEYQIDLEMDSIIVFDNGVRIGAYAHGNCAIDSIFQKDNL